MQDLKLGAPADRETLSKTLAPLLSDASIFGVDLISAGLSDRVLNAFVSMLQDLALCRYACCADCSILKGRYFHMKPFMDADFLLQTDTAKTLYHEAAEKMPFLTITTI